MYIKHVTFQSTRLLRASTIPPKTYVMPLDISIHKALASLDSGRHRKGNQFPDFNPQGSREPRPAGMEYALCSGQFQSTRLSRASTTELHIHFGCMPDFNPQGSREPRRKTTTPWRILIIFQSTRLSRASTDGIVSYYWWDNISIHKALASLDLKEINPDAYENISIHKALASLDNIPVSHPEPQ